MRKQLPAWVALCIIALIAGLLLGVTNDMTQSRIEEQTLAAAGEARKGVLPAASEFVQMQLSADAVVSNCYQGLSGGAIVGYTAQITAKGYGGEIEVTVGVSADGVITGVNVGGPNFSETAGLGARAKDPAFTEQFRGVKPPVALGDNIDGLTGATITTNAVLSAVNECVSYISTQPVGAAAK